MTTEFRPPTPESLAAAARRLEPELLEALALMADEIADDLGARLGMVAWEREEQIGAAQRRLLDLGGRRGTGPATAAPARVRELREQPLEALACCWEALRAGRSVHVESEADACPGAYRILRQMADLLGAGLFVTAPGILDHDHESWEWIGVETRHERVALLQTDADPELAAYVLARACLRRTGFDPRVVHRVLVAGSAERLERNLRRLWVGTQMGPVTDERAFAGPVDVSRAQRFIAAEAKWRARPGVTTICPGGQLQRADGASQCFLAPALFRAPALTTGELPSDEPKTCGPMLIVQPLASEAEAERLLAHYAGAHGGHLRFGAKARDLELRPIDGQIHGALLVERLPPGLPEPRP